MNKKRFDENKKEEGVIKVGAIVTSSRGKHKRIVYSQEEARLRTVKDVIEQMVEAVKTNQTLNLTVELLSLSLPGLAKLGKVSVFEI